MKNSRKQIVIIGLGMFGMSVAKELSKYECDVMAIDKNSKLVDAVAPYVTHAATVNAMDIEDFKELGLSNFDIAVVGMGDDLEASILVALTLKQVNVPYIIAKARDELHVRLLDMIGVNKVVQPEYDMGTRVARQIIHNNIIEKIQFDDDYCIVEIEVPKDWISRQLKDLNVRPKYNLNIICIEKPDNETKIFPTAEYIFQEKDSVMIITPNKETEKGGFIWKLQS